MTRETQTAFYARLDELGSVGSDELVRRMLDADARLERVLAVATAAGDGELAAANVRELATAQPELVTSSGRLTLAGAERLLGGVGE